MATYCICKQKDEEGVLWISCDTCKGWYHPTCVGLKNDDVDEDEENSWTCPLCAENDSFSHINGRQCGRTKCRNFVEGDELLCIDCKLVHIEKNSNKIKRMRIEDSKTNKKQSIKITDVKIQSSPSVKKELKELHNTPMKRIKVMETSKPKVSISPNKIEKQASSTRIPVNATKSNIDRVVKSVSPKFTVKTHMPQAHIAKSMKALDMDDLLLGTSRDKKTTPNNAMISPKITENPKRALNELSSSKLPQSTPSKREVENSPSVTSNSNTNGHILQPLKKRMLSFFENDNKSNAVCGSPSTNSEDETTSSPLNTPHSPLSSSPSLESLSVTSLHSTTTETVIINGHLDTNTIQKKGAQSSITTGKD